MLELRGRQGQSERRLETLWQLQVCVCLCSTPECACHPLWLCTSLAELCVRHFKASPSILKYPACALSLLAPWVYQSSQETASSNQAALAQLQELLEQQQQLQTKQQDYMVALRAQVSQANAACAGGHASCDELRAGLQQLQSRVDGTCRDLVRQGDQLADVHEKQQVR